MPFVETRGEKTSKTATTMADGPFRFIAARHFQRADRRRIDLIVIHSAEVQETPTSAEGIAAGFAREDAPVTSAHYCVDADSVVQCVLEKDVAHHAPGANENGIGIEHAGFARQTAAQWADAYSERMLRLSAALTAGLCLKYAIPPVFVDASGLRAKQRGITTHDEVTKAFGHGDHFDPGPSFPMAHYLALVRASMGVAGGGPLQPPGGLGGASVGGGEASAAGLLALAGVGVLLVVLSRR